MARRDQKHRYISTKFWSDNYVSNLDPLERYLYLYFLTNEHTTIAGVYELPIRHMAFETGLEADMLKKMLGRFERDKKIYYYEGYVIIANFTKHQNTESNTIKKGIEIILESLPEEIKDYMDRVCIGYTYVRRYSNSNSNSNGNGNGNGKEDVAIAPTPSKIARDFFKNSNGDQVNFTEYIIAKGVPRNIAEREIDKFVSYWTEPNKSGTKERWQLEKTFDVKRRLATWFNRVGQFNKQGSKGKNIIM